FDRFGGRRKAAQRKTQELNVDAAIAILFGISRPADDSFITTLRYARNEGMLESAVILHDLDTGNVPRVSRRGNYLGGYPRSRTSASKSHRLGKRRVGSPRRPESRHYGATATSLAV